MAFERFDIDDDPLKEEMSLAYQHLKSAAVWVISGAVDTLRDCGVRLGPNTNGDSRGQRARVVKGSLELCF